MTSFTVEKLKLNLNDFKKFCTKVKKGETQRISLY